MSQCCNSIWIWVLDSVFVILANYPNTKWLSQVQVYGWGSRGWCGWVLGWCGWGFRGCWGGSIVDGGGLGVVGWWSKCGGMGGLGVISRCHSIDQLPTLTASFCKQRCQYCIKLRNEKLDKYTISQHQRVTHFMHWNIPRARMSHRLEEVHPNQIKHLAVCTWYIVTNR